MHFHLPPIRITSYNVCYTKLLRASIKARIENISNPTKSEGKGQKNIDSNVASIASNAKKTR